jgi:hypothetical protein
MKPKLGNCFEETGETFLNLPIEERKKARIVHGRPRLTIPPHIRFGHAWIELDDEVIDPSGVIMPIGVYYAVGNINPMECVYYSYAEYTKKLLEHGHWGSWDLVEEEEERKLRKQLEKKEK